LCFVFTNDPNTLLVDVDDCELVGVGFVSAGFDVNQEENHEDEDDDAETVDDGDGLGDDAETVDDGDGLGDDAETVDDGDGLGDDAETLMFSDTTGLFV
jgi:hypothetical protein